MKSLDLAVEEEQEVFGRSEGVAAPSPKTSGQAYEARRASSESMGVSAPLLAAEPESVQQAKAEN